MRPMIKHIVYKNALFVLHCLPLDEAGQIFFGAALTSGWRKFYLLLSFGQNRCFCRKKFKRARIRSWVLLSLLLFIFPLFCTAGLIQVTLVYKHILIYNYDEYTVELLLIYSKQMKMKAIYFRGNQILVCFSFKIIFFIA